jgi:hypothetical protein
VTSRFCLYFVAILLGALDSFCNLDRSVRSYDSSWDDWKFDIERLRPPDKEWIAWVPDTSATVGADAVQTVMEGGAVSVTHTER